MCSWMQFQEEDEDGELFFVPGGLIPGTFLILLLIIILRLFTFPEIIFGKIPMEDLLSVGTVGEEIMSDTFPPIKC